MAFTASFSLPFVINKEGGPVRSFIFLDRQYTQMRRPVLTDRPTKMRKSGQGMSKATDCCYCLRKRSNKNKEDIHYMKSFSFKIDCQSLLIL